MLFRWIPVPGTMTPEPAPVDAVSEAAFPRSSTTEICVVPGARGLLSRAGGAALDSLQRGLNRFVGVQATGQSTAMEVAGEAALPRAGRLAHDLDERLDRLRAPGRPADAKPVEEGQRVADEHSS